MTGGSLFRPPRRGGAALALLAAGGCAYVAFRALRGLGRLWCRAGVLLGRVAGKLVLCWLGWARRRPLPALVLLLVALVLLSSALERR